MKNVHLLPTDKLIKSAGDLVRDKYGSIHIFTKNDGKEYGKTTTKLNIYITSDEEIKEGYWCIDKHNVVYKQETDKIFPAFTGSKKIILTTDDQLINNGVQAIDDEFLEWFVKNPSCEQVEVKIEYKDGYGNWSVYDKEFWYKHGNKPKFGTRFKITIPQEELKTSEEWQNQFPNPTVLDPDGWNRKNYQYSWFEEKITLAEYESRLSRSTVKGHILQEELKHPRVFSENGNELFFNEQGNLIREEPKMKLINKDVHEHCCSLEMLQLLYDKGMRYREWTEGAFTHNSLAEHRFNQGDVSHLKDTVTHQIVVEWLRVNHGIWVYTDFLGSWKYVIVKLKDNSRRTIEGFNSPKEATEAGIFYVLNNLI